MYEGTRFKGPRAETADGAETAGDRMDGTGTEGEGGGVTGKDYSLHVKPVEVIEASSQHLCQLFLHSFLGQLL